MAEAQEARPPARPHLPLELLPDTLAVCRLEPGAPLPPWACESSAFLTVSRTAEELSITTLQSTVPADVRCERDYRALRVRGPLPLDLIGILAAIADPLAAAGPEHLRYLDVRHRLRVGESTGPGASSPGAPAGGRPPDHALGGVSHGTASRLPRVPRTHPPSLRHKRHPFVVGYPGNRPLTVSGHTSYEGIR